MLVTTAIWSKTELILYTKTTVLTQTANNFYSKESIHSKQMQQTDEINHFCKQCCSMKNICMKCLTSSPSSSKSHKFSKFSWKLTINNEHSTMHNLSSVKMQTMTTTVAYFVVYGLIFNMVYVSWKHVAEFSTNVSK